MAIQNVHAFTEKVKSDPELQKRLLALPKDQSAIEKLIQIAKDAGYSFTFQEWKEARVATPGSRELTDEQLDGVAGGNWTYDPGPNPIC